jgi:hypothetical protein
VAVVEEEEAELHQQLRRRLPERRLETWSVDD